MQTYAIFTLLVATSTSAQPYSPNEADLKRRYLTCEQSAQSSRMHEAEAAACSQIYEELKRRVFDGSFGELRAWYESVQPSEGASE